MVYGRWLIDGYPKVSIHALLKFLVNILFAILQVLLFDLGSAYSKLEFWRKELWELSHIGVPDYDTEAKDSIVFGFLTYWFISQVSSTIHVLTRIVICIVMQSVVCIFNCSI